MDGRPCVAFTKWEKDGFQSACLGAGDSRAVKSGTVPAMLVAGFAIRLALALASEGSNDITTWEQFGALVSEGGLFGRYGDLRANGFVMNHPPLAAYGSAALRDLAVATGIPFAVVFKLPMIAADVAIAALLGRAAVRDGRSASGVTAVYALSPLAIAISAYHGNTDCLSVAFALVATLLSARGRDGAAGVALAAAMNVKLIPILLVPALLLQCRSPRAAGRFAAGLAVGLLPFVPFVVAQPVEFFGATLGHAYELNLWGPIAILHAAVETPALRGVAAPLAVSYLAWGRIFFLTLVVAVAVVGRTRTVWSPPTLAAASFSIFLAFAPAFAIQYLIYALPFLLLADFRTGVAYSTLAGLFAAIVYASYWTGTFPFYSRFVGGFPMPAPLFGLAAWAVLVVYLVRLVSASLRRGTAAIPAGPDAT